MILVQKDFSNGFLNLQIGRIKVYQGLHEVDISSASRGNWIIRFDNTASAAIEIVDTGVVDILEDVLISLGFLLGSSGTENSIIFKVPAIKASDLVVGENIRFKTLYAISNEWCTIQEFKKILKERLVNIEMFSDEFIDSLQINLF